MVSGRGDGSAASRRLNSSQLTSYDKSRKPHILRSGVDTKSIHFEWISKELECGICEKTIQKTMVVRNCMHRFCADCILQRIHTGIRKCPSCHKALPKKTPLKSDSNFDAIINKFALSVEKRCVKRPITESSSFYFTKRRIFDRKSPSKRLANSDSVPQPSLSERTSFKNAKTASVKYDAVLDPTMPLEMKPPTLIRTHSDASIPPLTIDEDIDPNLQQPTTSSPSKEDGACSSGICHDADGMKNKPNWQLSNHCEPTTIVVLQKSNSHERLNGMAPVAATKTVKVNGKSDCPAKCVTICPVPGPSAHNVKNQVDSLLNVSTATSNTEASNGNLLHINGNAKKVINSKGVDGFSLPSSLGTLGSGITDDLMMVSPRSSEYLYVPGKQRLSSGIESELVLNPDASVVNDDSLPVAAKHLRYIVTCSSTTVGHLCEYILQRVRVESCTERNKKPAEQSLHKRVLLCPVKSDLALDDVLVVNETSEGKFTTVNVCDRNSNSKSTSVFTINSPFTALDESLTIEQLKAEYWANRKRPLKLIFKFADQS